MTPERLQELRDFKPFQVRSLSDEELAQILDMALEACRMKSAVFNEEPWAALDIAGSAETERYKTLWFSGLQENEELATRADTLRLEAERLRRNAASFVLLYDSACKQVKELEAEAERLRAHHDKLHTICIWDSALAGTETDDEQWIADAESGKDREVPGNYRYKLAGTEVAKCRHGILRENCFACVKGNPLEVPSTGTEEKG